MIIIALFAYGLTTLAGLWLIEASNENNRIKKRSWILVDITGRLVCSVLFTRHSIFPVVSSLGLSRKRARSTLSGLRQRKPIPVLLLFNVFRGALWFVFTLHHPAGCQNSQRGFLDGTVGFVYRNRYGTYSTFRGHARYRSLCPFYRVGFLDDNCGVVYGMAVCKRKGITNEYENWHNP